MSSSLKARPLSRRQFLGAMVVAAGGAMLTSCAPAAPPAATKVAVPTSAPAEKGPQEITWVMWTWDGQHIKFVEDRVSVWTTNNPKYKATLKAEQMPYGDLYTKVLANLASGSGAPDILPIELNVFCRFAKGSIAEKSLIEITEFVAPERDKFIESRWFNFTTKGKLYGIDNGFNPGGYWYQPEIFEAAGIQMPIKNMDDFLVAGKQLKDKTSGKSHMAPIDDLDRSVFQQLLQLRGGQIFDKDGNCVLAGKEAVEVLKYLVDASNKDKIFLKAGGDSFWGAATYAAYKDGGAAGVILPDWYLDATLKPNLADMKGKWRVQAPPVWPSGGFKEYGYGGAGWTMTKQTKYPDILWDFMHFAFMTKESQVKKFQLIHYFPFMKDAIHDPGVTDVEDEYCGGQKVGAVFASVIDNASTFWNSKFWEEAVQALNNQLTQAYAGKIGAEEAINAADADIKAIVAKGED